MNSWILRGSAALLMSLPLALAAQPPAPKPAPTAPASDEEISEEIVVTAQKRATTLQEVRFS